MARLLKPKPCNLNPSLNHELKLKPETLDAEPKPCTRNPKPSTRKADSYTLNAAP